MVTSGRANIRVDYDRDLSSLIEAGNFAYRDSHFTRRLFPKLRSGKANIQCVVVQLDFDATPDQALRALHLRGLRPATVDELLTFAAQSQKIYGDAPILSLRAIEEGGRFVPGISLGERRSLMLGELPWGGRWLSGSLFLGVREFWPLGLARALGTFIN